MLVTIRSGCRSVGLRLVVLRLDYARFGLFLVTVRVAFVRLVLPLRYVVRITHYRWLPAFTTCSSCTFLLDVCCRSLLICWMLIVRIC